MGNTRSKFRWSWYAVSSGNVLFASYTQALKTAKYNEDTLLVIGCISGLFFLIVFLLTLALRSRISLAIKIVKEASRAMQAMPMIVLFPVVKYVMIMLLMAWSLAIVA